MIKHNQDGAVSGVVISLVLTVLLLVGAIGFGIWAFGSRQDYKDNVDAKITQAVQVAKQQEDTAQAKVYAEKEKQPLRTYTGPDAYGSVQIQYPKTWSAYVDDSGKDSSKPVDGYFAPSVVPSISNDSSVFAVRVQVLGQPYADVLDQLSQDQQSSGDNGSVPLKITPYALPKVPKTVGVKAVGTFSDKNNKLATMVVLPLRSQTLEIWTEGDRYQSDFNNYILPNATFVP